jgi:hypothetical protein
MRKPDYSGKVVDHLGYLLCDKCNGPGRPDDFRINVDHMYAPDPCDRCGTMGERRKNVDAD